MHVLIVGVSFLLALGLDVASSQIRWTKLPSNPVVLPGTGAAWDNGLVFFQSVLMQDSTYVMWYGVNQNLICRTGRATSPDGIHWTKDTLNPVLNVGPFGSWDEFGAWVPRVLWEGNHLTMYYQGASIAPFTRWNIGRATSPDGRVWQKDSSNPVLRVGLPGSWESDFIGPGSVLLNGSTYEMWYDGINGGWPGNSDAIGYATSVDGIHWTKYAQNPVLTSGPAGSWDHNGVGYNVAVILDAGVYHMWYTGNTLGDIWGTSGIGYAVSHDGIHWKKYPKNPVLTNGPPGTWDEHVYGPTVLFSASGLTMWYGGGSTFEATSYIGRATAPRSPAAITVDPQTVDFQNVYPGTASDTAYLVIDNWGFTPLTLGSLSHTSPAFAIVDSALLPVTVPPFGRTEFGLLFRPAQPGTSVQDSIAVASNDSLNPIVTVSLHGRGSGNVQQARPAVLYGISASSYGVQLYEIDRSSGTAQLTSRFSPHPPQGICAFAIRRTDNTLYAAFSSDTMTVVYRMSSVYGDLEPCGTIPLAEVSSMAFSTSDVLYLATGRGTMYRAVPPWSDTVFVGWTGHDFSGLTFSPATGMLWGSAGDTVFTVDTTSAAATIVGANGFAGPHSSIVFSSLGTLYGLFSGSIVIVDKTSGTASWIGTTGVPDLIGIAMDDAAVEDAARAGGPAKAWQLGQNYPNPFNLRTTIVYVLAASTPVSLNIFNTLGQEIATLVSAEQSAGSYKVEWDATNVASGVYFCRLVAGPYASTRKMILAK